MSYRVTFRLAALAMAVFTVGATRAATFDAPQAKVVAIAPSRHYVMLDQPAAFQKALADFIRAH